MIIILFMVITASGISVSIFHDLLENGHIKKTSKKECFRFYCYRGDNTLRHYPLKTNKTLVVGWSMNRLAMTRHCGISTMRTEIRREYDIKTAVRQTTIISSAIGVAM